jgi:hypothetical protein
MLMSYYPPQPDYYTRPLGSLLKGPLLKTPQGRVVVGTIIGYLILAFLLAIEVVAPPNKMEVSNAIGFCVMYPLIIFVIFLKYGVFPHSSLRPSWFYVAFFTLCAFIPFGVLLQHA